MDDSRDIPELTKRVTLSSHPRRALVSGNGATYPNAGSRYSGYEGSAEAAGSNGLLEYWHFLRDHKRALAGFAFVGALAGILYGIPKTPVFRASTSLEVLNLNEDFMNMRQSSPVTMTDASVDTSESQTQVKLLESDALLHRVMARLNPSRNAARSKQSPKSSALWRQWLHIPEAGLISKRELLLQGAAASMKVRVTPRTRIIELAADSTDPQLAADFVNTVAKEYIEGNLETRFQASEKTSEWLSHELDEARLRLQRSEDALQLYARNSRLIFTDSNTNISSEKLQQIQQQLSVSTADRMAKQSRYELAQNASPDSLPDVLNDGGLRQTKAKINDLRGEIAELNTIYNPDYGKTKRAQAALAESLINFDRDRAAIIERIKNDYREATRKETLLANAYDSQTSEVTGQGEKSIQYNILKREVDSNRQLYDTMLQQLKQSSIASAMRTSNVRVVDPAAVPEHPFSPNFKLNVILGTIFSLVGGSILLIARGGPDRTLHKPGDLRQWTHFPELGAIPRVTLEGNERSSRRVAKRIFEVKSDIRRRGTDQARLRSSVGMTSWREKSGNVADAFRTVLSSILFASGGGSRPQVFVFTSTSPADGKTTIVSNIGIAMAELGKKTLIIDGDLRRPRIHSVFSLERRGLGELLAVDSPPEALIDALVQRTNAPGLCILASGLASNAAPNLLYSPRLGKLLAKLKREFDTILIDTPPMGRMTDARVLAKLADGTILIARAEQTTGEAIMAASQQLQDDRSRVLGSILNDWNPKRWPAAYAEDERSYEEDDFASSERPIDATA